MVLHYSRNMMNIICFHYRNLCKMMYTFDFVICKTIFILMSAQLRWKMIEFCFSWSRFGKCFGVGAHKKISGIRAKATLYIQLWPMKLYLFSSLLILSQRYRNSLGSIRRGISALLVSLILINLRIVRV